MLTIITKLMLFAALFFLVSCTSPGPVTQYYSFFSDTEIRSNNAIIEDKSISIGVGPIVIPEFLDNPGIVSVTSSQQVKVSSQHAWAGDLKAAMLRVLADNLGQQWQLDKVSAFPWDNRIRPKYQIRLVFEELSGVRGGTVNLRVTWRLLSERGDELYLIRKVSLSEPTKSTSVNGYVASMNLLLNELSAEIATGVSRYIHKGM